MRILTLMAAASLFWPASALAQFTQQGSKLVGTGATGNAAQGQAVSLSADGNTAIVGGPNDNGGAGAVWIWTRSGTTWTQQGAKLVGSGAVGGANQGSAVALSADGNTAIVGGPNDEGSVGAVWIFVRNGGIWMQQGGKLVGSGAVGASQQGYAVALSADGNTAIAGGVGDNANAGAAWVFTRSGVTWTQQGAKLYGDGAVGPTSRQGVAVSLTGDGNFALVGGSGDNANAGAAWTFRRTLAGTWVHNLKLTGSGASGSAGFGQSVAFSADTYLALVGGTTDNSSLGAVWAFRRSGGFFGGGISWIPQGTKFIGTGSTGSPVYQGKAVAVSGNGNVAIESGPGDGGTPASGAAWIFTRSSSSNPSTDTYTQLGTKLVGSGAVDGASGANQGFSAFLSSDGLTAIVGGYLDNGQAGAAWIFAATQPAFPPHATADVDGDHFADMTLYKSNGDWTTLTSSGGFTSSSTVNWSSGPGYVPLGAGGDYDGDGRQDPVLYNHGTGEWRVTLSSSNYTSTLTRSFGGNGFVPVPGDYDGDGKTDFCTYNPVTGQWSYFLSRYNYSMVLDVFWGGLGYTPIGGRDFDGDGISDFAVYQRSTGRWMVLQSSTGGTTVLNIAFGGAGYSLVPGDYDGDRRADPALYQRATGTWYVLESSTGYTTTIAAQWGIVGDQPVPGDYDGDGKFDFTVYRRSAGYWFVLKSTTGYSTHMPPIPWGSGTDVPVSNAIDLFGSDAARASDADGDSLADMTVYNSASGFWHSLTSSTSFLGATNRGWGGTSYLPVPGDFDGDGKADLGLYVQASGDWYVLLSGAGFTTSLSKNVGGPGWAPVPGDFDGDGKTDFVVYETATGHWYGLLSSSLYTTTVSVMHGGTGFTPVAGDYDGDGIADPATYQGSSGQWSIRLSTSGYTASVTKALGGAGYVPVPSDFDADGRTDIVVYGTTSGLWTGYLSGYGFAHSLTTLNTSWGGTGYTPVKGDFDGDGKADLALYHQASSNWYILLSSSNYTTTISKSWGGPGYVVPAQYP